MFVYQIIDRYVLLGAPRESFGGWGVSESVSSTAVMLELARGFGHFLRSGWRPRRSILFCSWGGSPQNLIGSTGEQTNSFQLLNHRF